MNSSASKLVSDFYGSDFIKEVPSFERNPHMAYHIAGIDHEVNTNLQIAGYSKGSIKTIDQIYDLIHPSDFDKVISETGRGLAFFNDHIAIEHKIPGIISSEMLFRIKGKNGKRYTYLRRVILTEYSTNGRIAANETYLEDVSWMDPRNYAKIKINGVDTSFFDPDIDEIKHFKEVLSKREVQILRLLARGFQSREIAEFLKISALAVKHPPEEHTS